MAEKILMSNGVALWLAKNTKLDVNQIADFCNMHPLQIIKFREEASSNGIMECNPIDVSLLSLEEIKRCEEDRALKLESITVDQRLRSNAKKDGLIDGIIWVLKKCPDLDNLCIAKLLKCSSAIIKSVKNETYKNLDQIIPKNPVSLGLCTQQEFDECLLKYA